MNELTVARIDVEGQQHWPEQFPLVYQLQDCTCELQAVTGWLARNSTSLLKELDQHGAIVLRNFPLHDGIAFDHCVQAFGLHNFAYKNSLSNAVRHNVTERVFTANEAPAGIAIHLHHEMAQTPFYPSRLFFFCEQAPEAGGETPLCRSDILLDKLQQRIPAFIQRCQELGVRYTNVMPAEDDAGSGQGRSWRSTLRVDSPRSAEKKLQALGYSWEWLKEDNLRVTTATLPAVRKLPDGRRVFFNQLIAAFRGWQDTRNQSDKSICYGDGSDFDTGHLAALAETSDSLTVALPWKTGDMALVDNFLVMHGRRPFLGKRRVLASLAE
ncbi:MAG: TauD/TfdA family dioxygenase [Gammaproteobacteria bacterium]